MPESSSRTLPNWLRARDDAQLARLLRRRPDLGLPAPVDIETLAKRVAVRTSVQRAVDGLDAWRLRVLEALTLSSAPGEQPVLRAAAELLGSAEDSAELAGAIDDLLDLALIWGSVDDLHLIPTVLDAVGTYPAGLGRPAAILLRTVSDIVLAPVLRTLDLPAATQPRSGTSIARALQRPEVVQTLLADSDADELAVLHRLAAGPPLGLVRPAQPVPTSDAAPAPVRLVRRGLLVPIDAQTVELPREIGLALRRHAALGELVPDAPAIAVNDRTPAEADRAGTTAVLELLRLVETLADDWAAHPPALLRTGGVGVRELRRTARVLGADESVTALIVELASSAGLIGATNGIDPTYLPTPDYDTWIGHNPAQRWVTLAAAWLAMTRQPSLIGQRDDRQRVITVLGPDAERGTAPALRRQILAILATLAPGSVPTSREQVLARLAWTAPRRASSQRVLMEAILGEADLVALTSAGGLTGYGRAILLDAGASARDALAVALPEPVDHFVVQPDLTVVVPGPPTPAVGRELAQVADLESSGGASVYRISERTVRRALDAGATAATLIAMLTSRSTTTLPQALTYLIDDVARRHGLLRAGAATAYLRCDDPALLTRVVTDRAVRPLGLRLVASTVALSTAPVTRVLEVLRDAGYAPAGEAVDGSVVTLVDTAPRAPGRSSSRPVRIRPPADLDAHATELVRRIRAGDMTSEPIRPLPVDRPGFAPGLGIPGVTSATMLATIRDAIRSGRTVELGYVDTNGHATRHTVLPISMAGGTVRGHEPASRQLLALALHRITEVRVLPDELDDVDDLDIDLDGGASARPLRATGLVSDPQG